MIANDFSKDITAVRDFQLSLDGVMFLNRTIGSLEKEMAAGGAPMMQLRNAGNLSLVHDVLVPSTIDLAKATKLTTSVQKTHESDGSDNDIGAPAVAAYEGMSGSTIDALGRFFWKRPRNGSRITAKSGGNFLVTIMLRVWCESLSRRPIYRKGRMHP